MPKDYLKARLNEALEINNKIADLIKQLEQHQLKVVRTDKELLESEEKLLDTVRSLIGDLKAINLDETVLKNAIEELSGDIARKILNDLKQKLAQAIRKAEEIAKEKRAIEEARKSEEKELKEEWSEAITVEALLEQLKELNDRIERMSEKFIELAKTTQHKL
ncbi:hypothetical protein KY307_01280 [Candidatus Woesearchaeota archaeon]|nr:hypothetical protein [Candidatus Woesearchaeota archaeon]